MECDPHEKLLVQGPAKRILCCQSTEAHTQMVKCVAGARLGGKLVQ